MNAAATGAPLEAADLLTASLRHALDAPERPPRLEERGVVEATADGVAWVVGLPRVGLGEVVEFAGGATGLVLDLRERSLGVVLLSGEPAVAAGTRASRAGRVLDIPVGEALLGRVVDPAGRPRDGAGPLRASQRLPLERPAPRLLDRAPVVRPLQTGLKVVDALVPIGRGQRELVLGDRQTGKTSLALDTILNQRGQDVVCVYCAIGPRSSSLVDVLEQLHTAGAMEYTAVVLTTGEDPAGLRYLAPYAAFSVAEWFMEQGRDALVVLDDLSRHARAYRELSLVLRRPPGREAYPGDVFYLHARLLERATHLCPRLGGGSLTALPIAETQAEDLAGFIPTNLISITDGQVYLSARLVQQGLFPAVDVGLSVSRVGSAAQLPAYRTVTGALRLTHAQFQELEEFSRYGTRLEAATIARLEHGRRVREVLRQPPLRPVATIDQVVVLLAAEAGVFDHVPLAQVAAAEGQACDLARVRHSEVLARLEAGEELSAPDLRALEATAREATAARRS